MELSCQRLLHKEGAVWITMWRVAPSEGYMRFIFNEQVHKSLKDKLECSMLDYATVIRHSVLTEVVNTSETNDTTGFEQDVQRQSALCRLRSDESSESEHVYRMLVPNDFPEPSVSFIHLKSDKH